MHEKNVLPGRASRGGGAKLEPKIQNIWLLGYFKSTHTLQSNYHQKENRKFVF